MVGTAGLTLSCALFQSSQDPSAVTRASLAPIVHAHLCEARLWYSYNEGVRLARARIVVTTDPSPESENDDLRKLYYDRRLR